MPNITGGFKVNEAEDMKPKQRLSWFKPAVFYSKGREILTDPVCLDAEAGTRAELAKKPKRTEVINFLLSLSAADTSYLEIGVADPNRNFNLIESKVKYGVDPGVNRPPMPVDFRMTSDEFFLKLSNGDLLPKGTLFDVIFIDGLHLALQVDKDIRNAWKHLKDDGFIVLHDCNPPTEWHARESFRYRHTPAFWFWNGTTWKAFLKWRFEPSVRSCCIDTDWGVGVLSKRHAIGSSIEEANPFFEFHLLEEDRRRLLNLVDFDTFKKSVQAGVQPL